MAHFYLDDSLAAQLEAAGGGPEAVVALRGPDARHAVTVARVRPGESLRLGDGAGLVLHGTVTDVDSAELRLRVHEVERHALPTPRILLAQALAKGDRDELAVQAATELGVAGVIPWQAARSVSRWEGAKVAKGVARWSSIVREASKQSLRPWLPEVEQLVSTAPLAARASGAVMIVLDTAAERPLSSVTAAELGEGDLVLAVGPEGGIADAELAQLEAAGALRVRLGDTVLRTSTAGPAAIALLNAALGRW
ncbi:MAG: 16S rRNA (uracil(1498)-N(3))-methyltransferase [Microcella sp.]|uniref:16S rRNA (uracil(1498)-N(3))-methyltransferase n=1 Tax=Microcella sp. TaxID=1913979 RepID=UPI0033163112